MNLRGLGVAVAVAVALVLGACSQKDEVDKGASAGAKAARQTLTVDAVATQARGFTVGAMMSANPVYVFFDPQCPHCGHLWQQSLALQSKLKFVWIPIAFSNRSPSLEQGAALLASTKPVDLMNEHEALLFDKKGGIAASKDVPAELEKAIKANTALLNAFAIESVPFLVTKHVKTGELVSHNGAMDAQALAELVGLAPTP